MPARTQSHPRPPETLDWVRQGLGVATLVGVLWLNALAGSGSLSGESIGVIANRYPSAFLPAGYVFGIWSLIYLGLAAYAVYQALPTQRGRPLLRRVGWWWPINGLLNVAWIATFSFSRFGAALLIMVALLGSLVTIHLRIGVEDELGAADRAFVAIPFGGYLAWISVALIANTFQYVTYVEWNGFGIPGTAWSVVMMGVATGLGIFMAWRRRVWVFPLVVAWALVGIAVRYRDSLVLMASAAVFVSIGLTLLAADRLRSHAEAEHEAAEWRESV